MTDNRPGYSATSCGGAAAAWLVTCLGYPGIALADPGLSSLGVLAGLFGIIFAVVGLGVLIVIPGLITAYRLKRQGQRGTRAQKICLGLTITYLVILLPVALGMIIKPLLQPWPVALFACYLIALAYTVLYFYNSHDSRKTVFVAAAMLFTLMLVRAPELISHTRYDYVENMPLENPLTLLEQPDSAYFRLEDGRFFFFEDPNSYFGQLEKFPADTQLEIAATPNSNGLYTVYGAVHTQQYYHHQQDTPEALITIPQRTVTMKIYESQSIGRARLLDDNWQAGDSVLQRAVNTYCCDPRWVQELLARGANAKQVNVGSKWTLLHSMAGHSPYGQNVQHTARLLIAQGADLNARDGQLQSAFHATFRTIVGDRGRDAESQDSQRAYLTLLLELGANPNSQDKDGRTAMHDAVYGRRFDLAQLLLEYSASPGVRDKYGKSPADIGIDYLNNQKAVLSDAEERDLAVLVAVMARGRKTQN